MKNNFPSSFLSFLVNGVKMITLLAFLLSSNYGISQINPNELQHVDSQIQAYRIKIEHVKSTPSENTEALESGWYDEMRAELGKLFDQKRNIIFNQTGKKWVAKEEFEEVLEKKKPLLLNDSNYIIEQN